MTLIPKPAKLNALFRLKRAGVPFSSVVDVGVREATPELMMAFPDLEHHLFEPMIESHGAIRANYAAIRHHLYGMALSDADAQKFLVVSALERDGVPTHSSMQDEPKPVDGRSITACYDLPVRRFDRLALSVADNFLLKIDVDGPELAVLRGFGEQLRRASAVVIEATALTWAERMNFIASRGFRLFDFVDITHYGPSLYQFDAVFLRQDLVSPATSPDISQFDPSLWRPLAA